VAFDESGISSTVPDWSRERPVKFWDPGNKLLKTLRHYSKIDKVPKIIRPLFRYYIVLRYRFWSAVTGADIPLNARIAGGLVLQHPTGIVIHSKASIGVNCLILQNVTIVAGVTIQGHVDIGAGAKIVRPVVVGEHARIGANAVVLEDVPPFATVVGIPAKVTRVRKH